MNIHNRKEFDMDNQLFRKNSMERISSPEQLSDYMRVTSPKLWMILTAVIVLLIGLIVYASTATMESTLSVKAEVTTDTYDGVEMTSVIISLPPSDRELVKPDMTVRIAGIEGKVSFILENGEEVSLVVDIGDTMLHVPNGIYDAEIVTESTTPISFLLN